MRFVIKSLIALASTAAATIGTTVAVKKSEKLGKIYDEKMPEVVKNNLKVVETKSSAAYVATKAVAVNQYKAAKDAAAAGVVVYQATRTVQQKDCPQEVRTQLVAVSTAQQALAAARKNMAEAKAAKK